MNNEQVLAEIHQTAANCWEETSTLAEKIANFLEAHCTAPEGRIFQAMSTPRVGVTPHGDKIYFVQFFTGPVLDFAQMEEAAVLLIETETGELHVLRTHEIPSRSTE